MPNQVLQVAAVIAAGVVSKPGVDLDKPEELAKQVIAIAKELIKAADE